MVVFSPLTYGRACFLLAFFSGNGARCSCSGGCVGNVGLVGIFSFFLGFDWKLVSLLGWPFLFFFSGGSGVGIGSLRSGDFGLN